METDKEFEQLAKDVQKKLDELNEIISYYPNLTFKFLEISNGGTFRNTFSVRGNLNIASIGYSYEYIHDPNTD